MLLFRLGEEKKDERVILLVGRKTGGPLWWLLVEPNTGTYLK